MMELTSKHLFLKLGMVTNTIKLIKIRDFFKVVKITSLDNFLVLGHLSSEVIGCLRSKK